MPLPTARDCPRIAESLRAVARWVEEQAPAILNATTINRDGHGERHLDLDPLTGRCPHGIGGGVGCGQCRPDDVKLTAVEAAAEAGLADRRLVEIQTHLAAALSNIDATGEDIVRWVQRGQKLVTAPKPQPADDGPAACVEMYCEDQAVKAGRCEPCYVWNRRNNGNPVPRAIIDDRVRRRDNAKVYVTGPRQGDAA
jgi:hypothetical protein